MPNPLPYTLKLSLSAMTAARGGRPVAAGVSFDLSPGDALSLRGPNGTGKTSILRAIAGLSRPEAGSVSFAEDDTLIDPEEARACHLHWLGGEDGLAGKLTVAETVRFWAQLLGGEPLPEATLTQHLASVKLGTKADSPVGALSTGQRRRVGLARLLCVPRALWLLDEPLSGLDDQGRDLLMGAIASHRAQGGIVLMATHDGQIDGARTLRLAGLPPGARS